MKGKTPMVFLLKRTRTSWNEFSSMDAYTRQNYERTTASGIYILCTQTARNGFLRRDQASTVPLVPSMHLTGKHLFALLLILGGIETNPDPGPCAICHRSNWNQYGVWCGRGGWVHMNCANIEQWNKKFVCKRCSWCKIMEASPTRQSLPTDDNTPQHSSTE